MQRKKIFIILIFIFVVIFLSACAGGGATATSWPGFTVDLETETVYVANNQHVYAVNLSNGTQKWRFPQESEKDLNLFAPPVITDDGQLIVGAYNTIFYSLNPENGQLNWTFDGSQGRYIAGALTMGEEIYAPTQGSILYALDLEGNPRWTFETESEQWSTPISDNGSLYLPSMDHHVYALENQTGKLIWNSDKIGGAIAGDPTLSPDGVLYVGTLTSEVIALDAENGRVVWRSPTEGWVWSGPTLEGEKLYFGDLSGMFYAMNAADGSVIWQIHPDTADKRGINGKPLLFDDTLYYGSESGNFYAVDPETGNIRWSKTFEGKIYPGPQIAGDTIVISTQGTDALLVALQPNGNQRWMFIPPK